MLKALKALRHAWRRARSHTDAAEHSEAARWDFKRRQKSRRSAGPAAAERLLKELRDEDLQALLRRFHGVPLDRGERGAPQRSDLRVGQARPRGRSSSGFPGDRSAELGADGSEFRA